MAEFASKGVAGSGLGLGIAGTALGILNSGFFGGGWFGGCDRGGYGRGDYDRGCCGEDHRVNRYELNLVRELAAKDAIIVDKDSKLYTDHKVCELSEKVNCMEKDFMNRFCRDEREIDHCECMIRETNICMRDNYIPAHKVLRPWDICPMPHYEGESEGRDGRRRERRECPECKPEGHKPKHTA